MDEGKGETPAGGQGELTVLSDPHRIRSDCRLIARAASEGWGMNPTERKQVRSRLVEIVETRAVMVTTTMGDEEVQIPDGPTADRNSVAAARVLVAIDALDQADRHHVEGHNQKERHHADDVARGAGGTTVNVGVQVNTLTDERRIQIAAEAGVLHLLPAELQEKAKGAESTH